MKTEKEPATGDPTAQEPAAPMLRYTPKPKGSWMKLYGSMKDCELYPEALRHGAEWRAQMNLERR